MGNQPLSRRRPGKAGPEQTYGLARRTVGQFTGHEGWSVIAISQNGGAIAAILSNLGIIDAYRASGLYSRATHYAVSRS